MSGKLLVNRPNDNVDGRRNVMQISLRFVLSFLVCVCDREFVLLLCLVSG